LLKDNGSNPLAPTKIKKECIVMSLSKKGSEARRKVLNVYPTAKLIKYQTYYNEGRYGIYIEIPNQKLKYLELDRNNSPTKDKAWIDAYKSILKDCLTMFES
jgi:hypothetical protein